MKPTPCFLHHAIRGQLGLQCEPPPGLWATIDNAKETEVSERVGLEIGSFHHYILNLTAGIYFTLPGFSLLAVRNLGPTSYMPGVILYAGSNLYPFNVVPIGESFCFRPSGTILALGDYFNNIRLEVFGMLIID